jgi:Mlc titration factor MtfA (ptsG expression regulator)
LTQLVVLGLLLAAVAAWFAWRHFYRSRREKTFNRRFPDAWIDILERNVSIYRGLPQSMRSQLHGHVNVFLEEKVFVGCGGLEISDDIRVTIAGYACLLLLNRITDYYPGFTTILVYPDTYVAREVMRDGELETVEEQARAGESWHRGPVVLSWEDVRRADDRTHRGENVALHEFAHKLDEENERLNGLPVLADRRQYASWAEVFSREFDALKRSVERGEPTLLDSYGAESPSEFFAVVTEAFFQRPRELTLRHPLLYEQMRRYFNLDPASWKEMENR